MGKYLNQEVKNRILNMNIEQFVRKVEAMRATQKNYFKFRDPTLLRKSKVLEKEVDDEIAAYYKEEAEKSQGTFFVDDH